MTDFLLYLQSKKAIDDRTLNPLVRERLLQELQRRWGTLEVRGVGAGIGTMIERLDSWGLLKEARYRAIDRSAQGLEVARDRLQARGFEAAYPSHPGVGCDLRRGSLSVTLEAVDLHEFLKQEHPGWDLVVAHAVLDLFVLGDVLPALIQKLRPGGYLYSSLNFDGQTCFLPVLEESLDRRVVERYHQTMDERVIDGRPSGDSQCGRHLVRDLKALGVTVLARGRSDWVVRPDSEGERYFLHFILDTVDQALRPFGDAELAGWVARRHAQVDEGVLEFRARHLDVLARKPGP